MAGPPLLYMILSAAAGAAGQGHLVALFNNSIIAHVELSVNSKHPMHRPLREVATASATDARTHHASVELTNNSIGVIVEGAE
jgi:hypothetical protein